MPFSSLLALRAGAIIAITLMPLGASADPPFLSMQEAVSLALKRDPGILGMRAQITGAHDAAVSAGQWPDPKLSVGLLNLPTNSYAVGQDSMTMQTVGIEQDFPTGDTHSLSQTRGQQLADAQAAAVKDRELQVTRDVRQTWLRLYYAQHAYPLVKQSEQTFEGLLDITRSRYANGQGNEQDLARAELEMGMLQERELDLQADIDEARASLVKYVGSDATERPLEEALPALPDPPDQVELLNHLPQHPRLVAANTEIAAADTATDIARQTYKPTWGVSMDYGHRPGVDANGMRYTNMLSAMVTVSLPLFTGDRQDRTVSAAEAQASTTRYARDDALRELKQMLDADWAHWEHLAHVRDLYAKTILPSSTLNTQAALNSYRNGSANFDELARAQITDLDSRTQQLKADTDYLSMQAELLYLAGGQP